MLDIILLMEDRVLYTPPEIRVKTPDMTAYQENPHKESIMRLRGLIGYLIDQASDADKPTEDKVKVLFGGANPNKDTLEALNLIAGQFQDKAEIDVVDADKSAAKRLKSALREEINVRQMRVENVPPTENGYSLVVLDNTHAFMNPNTLDQSLGTIKEILSENGQLLLVVNNPQIGLVHKVIRLVTRQPDNYPNLQIHYRKPEALIKIAQDQGLYLVRAGLYGRTNDILMFKSKPPDHQVHQDVDFDEVVERHHLASFSNDRVY